MVDGEGYPRLIDLGFAKKIPFTLVVDGKPEVRSLSPPTRQIRWDVTVARCCGTNAPRDNTTLLIHSSPHRPRHMCCNDCPPLPIPLRPLLRRTIGSKQTTWSRFIRSRSPCAGLPSTSHRSSFSTAATTSETQYVYFFSSCVRELTHVLQSDACWPPISHAWTC